MHFFQIKRPCLNPGNGNKKATETEKKFFLEKIGTETEKKGCFPPET